MMMDPSERAMVRQYITDRDAMSRALDDAGVESNGPEDTLLARLARLIADANKDSERADASERSELKWKDAHDSEKAAREALRAKAAAALTKGRPEDIIALAAELDKPSARKP